MSGSTNERGTVVAAVVRRGNKMLVCQRPLHKHHGGLWEFPGGKVEHQETLNAAAQRELAEELDFFGMMKTPAVAVLGVMIKHSIHHRGQLSTYLRPMGCKVPGIYGPSADTEK